ncbi:hypothetical protein L596_007434 [Steinernema carpocapsae]|uniref:Uncharacterized protein n=1 Tax=Steinernema carpocapsae TaxID=34508 RepID=A0A4V6XWJ9_STECR|nr:hypothetical protein L596_007434 [Steinernema carpocapsae]
MMEFFGVQRFCPPWLQLDTAVHSITKKLNLRKLRQILQLRDDQLYPEISYNAEGGRLSTGRITVPLSN